MDSRVHCSEPEGADWQLHQCILGIDCSTGCGNLRRFSVHGDFRAASTVGCIHYFASMLWILVTSRLLIMYPLLLRFLHPSFLSEASSSM
jgi:hypothetical protein